MLQQQRMFNGHASIVGFFRLRRGGAVSGAALKAMCRGTPAAGGGALGGGGGGGGAAGGSGGRGDGLCGAAGGARSGAGAAPRGGGPLLHPKTPNSAPHCKP